MKVCFLCNQIAAWGKIGGFGTNLRRLGRGLAAAGVDVHVVTPRRKGQGRIEQLDGMTVHGISWREVFFGTPLYREIDADIYHTQEPNLSGAWARRLLPDKPHVVTCMDPRDWSDWAQEWWHATWLRRAKWPLQWWYEDGPGVRHAVRQADRVYVEAEFLRDKTQRHYQLCQLPEVLPKPIPIPDGPFEKSERPLCVFLGRMDPRKRPEVVLQLARRVPDCDFVVVGRAHDRSYQRKLEQLAAGIPNLQLWGFVDGFTDSRLSQLLSRAWVLVHPAIREGLPTAFQEASVHEMAILACVDPGGYVSRFGSVVSPHATLADWESALKHMLASAWREKGQAGRQYNIEQHALERSVELHLQAYQSLLEQPRSPVAKPRRMTWLANARRSIGSLFRGGRPDTRPQGPDGVRQLGYRTYVGGRWEELGQLQFEFLRREGLQAEHTLLDVACGSLRAGRLLIPYLAPGHYFGVEKEADLIEAGVAHELPPVVRESKVPTFVVTSQFEMPPVQQPMDYVWMHSLWTHLPQAVITQCLTQVRQVSGERTRVFATFFEADRPRENPAEAHDHATFFYTRDELSQLAQQAGWELIYRGDWGHPRGQKMVELRLARREITA